VITRSIDRLGIHPACKGLEGLATLANGHPGLEKLLCAVVHDLLLKPSCSAWPK